LIEGRRFLESILDEFWSLGHASRCILIPGNHDVWRTTWGCASGYKRRRDRLCEWNAGFSGWSFVAPKMAAAEGTEVKPYSMVDYYAGALGQPVSTPEPKGVRELDVDGLIKQRATAALRFCEYFPSFKLAFLKLDSNELQRRPAHIARGRVGPRQQEAMDEILRHYDDATKKTATPFSEARRIALVHHHLTRLPNVKLEKWMMMDDAGQVAIWLARHGVRLVLHGHFHFADVVGLTYWNKGSNNSKVQTIVVSGGSGTALDVDDGQNSYHAITLSNFRTNIERHFVFPNRYESKFEFVHKPTLRIEDDAPQDIPVFLEALEALILEEERYADQKHTYKLVKSIGYIDANRTYFGSVELQGTNGTTEDLQWIPFAGVAVGAQYFEELDFQATDLDDGSNLQLQKLAQRPIYVFPFRIFKAVPPGGNFKIRLTFRLKTVMLNERDYDMVSLLRFPRGVERTELCLLSARTMLGPSVWELRGDKLQRSKSTLEPVQRTPENPPLNNKVGGFTINIDSPPALVYLLLYEKLS